MKTIKHILVVTVLILINIACNRDNIDPITPIGQGVDETAPMVTFKYPLEGTKIKVFEEVTSITIKIEVTDDIEILSISALMDGTEFASFNSFMDYRRALEEFSYDGLTDGDHVLTIVAKDIEGKTTNAEVNFVKEPAYTAMFDGESVYMPFDGDYMNLIGFNFATVVGTPGFAGKGFAGPDAYRGTTDSYITIPAEGLLSDEFSAAFWYKVSGSPDRAGILVIGANDQRTQGIRMFREGSGTEQRIKLNVGFGTGESWNDGGLIDVAAGEWVHIAFSITADKNTIYFNGIEQRSSDMGAPVDWTGCEDITIGAGGETFSYWDHKSDNSDLDELRLFDKAITQSDIQIMMNSFNPYVSPFDGESFYMPFEGGFIDLVGSTAAAVVGTPSITDDAQDGAGAYLGATDSYLTHPAEGLMSSQFSAAFWYKVDASPDRSGILVVGADENRNQGFRMLREGSADEQRIKLNVGFGTGESWNDGDIIDVAAGEWVHVAFTISDTKNTIYFNGVEKRSSDMGAPIDWTGCETLTIAAGGETFSYWDHLSDNSSMDELRFFNKALSAEEIEAVYGGAIAYAPKYDGEVFFMPFDGSYTEQNSLVNATEVGTPGYAGASVQGSDAYAGAADSYLTFPTDGLTNDEFSASFWLNVNADPDRAGILVIGPPDAGNPDAANNRTSGFRFLREDAGGMQRFKLNVGQGEADVWVDGGDAADVDPTTGNWVHFAFTISATDAIVYIDGELAAQSTITGVDWTDCDIMSVMSGAPRFFGWDHFSDNSFMDELRIFNKALTQTEIQTIMSDDI
ncbi:MAG: LamG domain-containing protein [Bacteroidales bacterium]|jgi:hypothetical protein|nr:LamG domain-containing protein [Bacteroidales bacterium]